MEIQIKNSFDKVTKSKIFKEVFIWCLIIGAIGILESLAQVNFCSYFPIELCDFANLLIGALCRLGLKTLGEYKKGIEPPIKEIEGVEFIDRNDNIK